MGGGGGGGGGGNKSPVCTKLLVLSSAFAFMDELNCCCCCWIAFASLVSSRETYGVADREPKFCSMSLFGLSLLAGLCEAIPLELTLDLSAFIFTLVLLPLPVTLSSLFFL